jgi:hypothetical protein
MCSIPLADQHDAAVYLTATALLRPAAIRKRRWKSDTATHEVGIISFHDHHHQ